MTFGFSAQSDESRHMTLGLEVIKFMLEQDEGNVPIVQDWIDKWFWRGLARKIRRGGLFSADYRDGKSAAKNPARTAGDGGQNHHRGGNQGGRISHERLA